MNKSAYYRIVLHILLDIALFYCTINGWWYIALPLGIIGVWYFAFFVEFIIAGLIYDAIFGSDIISSISGWYGTTVSVILTLLISIAKKQIRK